MNQIKLKSYLGSLYDTRKYEIVVQRIDIILCRDATGDLHHYQAAKKGNQRRDPSLSVFIIWLHLMKFVDNCYRQNHSESLVLNAQIFSV